VNNYLQLPTEAAAHLRRLSAVQLYIWADAWTFQQNGQQAYRSNAKLAQMLDISPRSVSRAIQGLHEAGMLSVRIQQEGETIKRYVTATLPTRTSPPDTNVVGVPTPTSGGYRHERHGGTDTNVHIIDKKNREVNREVKRETRTREVVWPFDSDQFMNAWKEWEADRRERRIKAYTTRGLQTALHELQTMSNNDERTAIRIIGQSIAKGWQGLFPIRNERQPARPERPRGPDITPDDVARIVATRWGPKFPRADK
jgi:DNA-binding Lrp family transcriptional regulator